MTLAALRRATAADHDSVDALIDPNGLVDAAYYVAVVSGLIESAEVVEATLPLSPLEIFSKRAAIDAEVSFVDGLTGARPVERRSGAEAHLLGSGPHLRATMLGLLYVYVGSALGGLHLLRVARTASWWRHDREHILLRPYGDQLGGRWRAVLDALDSLDHDETNTAVMAARAGFDLHRRSLVEHLSVGGFG